MCLESIFADGKLKLQETAKASHITLSVSASIVRNISPDIVCMKSLLVVVTAFVVMIELRTANATVSVPVVVSTLYDSAPRIYDFAVNDDGNVFYVVPGRNAVYRLSSGAYAATPLLVAGSESSRGTMDGAGLVARFYNPQGITFDIANNIAYITDNFNCRIRALHVSSNITVATLAGSSLGHTDGVGTLAQFYYPWGIAYHSSGVLYVADCYYNNAVAYYTGYFRKVIVSVANVTTITLVSRDYYYYLCVNGNGSLFYATTFNNVLLVNVSSGKITVLAGLFGAPGIIDGPGQSARFNYLQGIALNSDETALILADQNNQRIRKLDLATNNVTTIAGSATKGAIDGPGLSSTFNYPVGAKWHCDMTSALCGLLVADLLNNALRFVAIEGPTNTATFSAQSTRSTELTRTESTSGATSLSRSSTISLSRSLSRYSRTWSRSEVDTSSLTATSLPTQSSSQSDSNDRSNSNSLSASSTSTSVLSSSNSATSTSSRSITRHSPSASAIISLSSSISLSGSLNHSISRHTPSASTTIYCALVPADGSTSVGSLQSFNATSATSVTEVIPLTPPAAAAVSNSSVAISRTTLLQNLPFGVNLSLSLGGTVRGGPVDGWELVSALVQAFPIDSLFPLVVATAPTTLLSTAVAGRTQTLAVLLDPPLTFGTNPSSPRWLPTSLSTFRSVTLVLKLSLRCPTDHSISTDVSFEVPCPGQVQPLASEVKSASIVALYATSLAGAAGSGAVGRLGAVRNLVLCSGKHVGPKGCCHW